MKLFKLWVHQHTFCEDALIVNPKEFPDCHTGDVLEIYHPDEQTKSKYLLLQINSIRSDFQQKDTISIEQSIANLFQLRTYSDVVVHKVEHCDVEVDLVEVVIKDQYMSRSDMWRLSKALEGKCVYISKKISFCGLRGQIHELWKKGKQMTCGVISKDTRVVYRSLSAQIFLFIQMSCEMWEFDLHGDLYFEKVINGFLYELFSQWKNKKANHDVTIVLFSRRFYQIQSEDFTREKRKSILRDPHGRYYEDFYQVLVRGERKDDWLPVLVTLKYHINQYQKCTTCQGELAIGVNSTAHEGNFLEAINLSMNIFEKHYQDHNFDCTGQSILVITPGTGVFEVDRGLNSITKQRMIDSGVAVDLICMAEQPLHSVPLLKFFDKGGGNEVKLGDDYNIPHWMNHSFYASPNSKDKHNAFLPRIQLPDVVFNWFGSDPEKNHFLKGLHKNFQPRNAKEQEKNQILDFVNFDEFDAKIFCKKTFRTSPRENFNGRVSVPLFPAVASETDFDKLITLRQDDIIVANENSQNVREKGVYIPSPSKMSDVQLGKRFLSSSLDHIPNENYLSEEMSQKDERKEARDELYPLVGSADAPRKLTGFPAKHLHDSRRTLFNPFKPLNIPCRWTCNRHRWAHSFPKGQDGSAIHRQFLKSSDSKTKEMASEKEGDIQIKQDRVQDKLALTRRKGNIRTKFHHHVDAVEQDWTAEVETSVDWKSLILPACLPLTTEYCPDMKALDTDYLEFHYELCIGDDDDQCGSNEFVTSKTRSTINPPRYDEQINSHAVSVNTMIIELVSQRLSKGFQILTDPPHQERPTFSTFMSKDHDFESQEYFLSLGRNIHRLSVVPKQSQINVTRYRPRHVRGLEPLSYWYQLQNGHTVTSKVQETEFQHDELDKYNWNYLDQHISGIQDFAEMVESLRYWKSRFLLLPMPSRKKPVEGNGGVNGKTCVEGMVKYLEVLNGIKGSKVPRRLSHPLSYKASLFKPTNSQDNKNDANKLLEKRNELKDLEVQGRCENKSSGESSGDQSNLSSDSKSNVSIEDTLTVNSPLERIAAAFLDSSSGFPFLPTTKGLQPNSFISIDCVQWMMHSVEGLNEKKDCMTIAQKMVDVKIIQHASGNARQDFVYGFVIFHINPKTEWNAPKEKQTHNLDATCASVIFEDCQQQFQENWFEVIFDCTNTVPPFLASDEKILQHYENATNIKHVPFAKRTRVKSTSQIPHIQDCSIGPMYKTVHMNCDLLRKSNRNESAIIRYHGIYCTSHAFEIEVHWIEATGSVVNDLVQGWARKATSCGFHLVPVPVNPFPDRLSNNMDPLRLPLFIPVDVTVLQDVLKSFDHSYYELRVVLILEAILTKFEFLKDSPCKGVHDQPNIVSTPMQCRGNYYIHTSGAVFAQIIDQDIAVDWSNYVGFYWTNNFSLTKKWRTSSTGDIEFALKILTEFQQFCSNTCGALEAFCKSMTHNF